ncbi:MAG TPA: hypothetical protein VJ914_00110 [Pseudonocardiaceae bacterium]|nr:hypothetical protein [Pseudonocardiaceae bacterium]
MDDLDRLDTADSTDEGMRARVERWLERRQRRLDARESWALPEPTHSRAVGEAVVMADYLTHATAEAAATRPGHRS